MIKVGITVFAGMAMLVCVSAQVQAGGMYETYSSYKDPVSAAVAVPAPMPIPETNAWYVRVDLGYAAFQEPDLYEGRQYELAGTSIDGTWSIGGGVGYYFTERLRGDITVDYFADAEVSGWNYDTTAPVVDVCANSNCIAPSLWPTFIGTLTVMERLRPILVWGLV